MTPLLIGLGLFLALGAAAAALSSAPSVANRCGALGVVCGTIAAAGTAIEALREGRAVAWSAAWDPAHGALHVGLDALSAFFLIPVLVLGACAAVYGASYMADQPRRKSLGGHWFFVNLFVAGMVGVLIARSVVLFLVTWEIMSLAAFVLVTYEHQHAEVRRAGWIYLIAAHLGVACILAALLLLGNRAGTFDFDQLRHAAVLTQGFASLVFFLALVGFGAKIGLIPVHVWLPEAHPAAPSHVSALMSGVMVKMGLYGLLRFATFLGPPPAWWGICLGTAGAATALFGIAMAIDQRDVKRVLAYSTIENMGLVVLSLGVGVWGWAVGQTAISVLGFAAALIHIWNHAAMKGLMFFAAGSLLHATGSKDMDRMGGLMRRMPWTASTMLLGAVAVAALPPLNGFVGKWLLFLGLANVGLERSDAWGAGALLATGAIAAVGGLAAVTFARLVGIALLGAPRSEAASRAHESPWAMRLPMLVLAAVCIAAALFPWSFLACTRQVVEVVTNGEIADARAWAPIGESLSTLSVMNAMLWVGGVLVGGLLVRLFFRGGVARDATWGCGYVAPAARMQYTGTSFGELLASRLLPRWLRPTDTVDRPLGLFPASGSFSSTCPDPVTRRVYEPFFARWARRFAVLRILQQGKMHVYLMYIMAIVVIGLSWVAVRGWSAGH